MPGTAFSSVASPIPIQLHLVPALAENCALLEVNASVAAVLHPNALSTTVAEAVTGVPSTGPVPADRLLMPMNPTVSAPLVFATRYRLPAASACSALAPCVDTAY